MTAQHTEGGKNYGGKDKKDRKDAYLDETMNILLDLIQISSAAPVVK